MELPEGWEAAQPGEVTPSVNYTYWYQLPGKFEMEVYWDKGGDGFHHIVVIRWRDDWNNMIRSDKAESEEEALERAVEIMKELNQE